jgi:hypothetical protein
MATQPQHEAVRYRACLSKRPLGRDAAQRIATNQRRHGHDVRAYRCPFSAGNRHYHVGHPPSLAGLVAIAAAIRDLPPARGAT